MNSIFQTSADVTEHSDFSNVHLVHVVRQYFPNVGGLEDVVRNLVSEQKGRFASVKVITLDRLFADPGTILAGRERIDGVAVHRIPFRGSSRYPIAPSIVKEIMDADLVHVHAVDFFFDALALTRWWHRKPLVATTHGGFFHTSSFATLKAAWFNTLTRYSANRYSALACCSDSDFNLFQKIAPARVSLIENGVNLRKFAGAAAGSPQHVITLGRFSSNKRLDRLIDVMANLISTDADWHLHIAGVESDLTKRDLLERADAAGLGGKVCVHVGLSDQQLRALMTECSLFVSASDYEGFGLALIEALSAGLVPVVQANDAFVALARQNPLIRLTDYADAPTSADALRSALQDLRQDPDIRTHAIDSVQRFGWKHTAHLYDELYRKALLD
ncbi:glycosyltransferase family 4 protein [Roseibium salinum]|uniref:glycosyltransferase family 4 protein n=1 Tax=Roseibium salinum TaxID=1604349 RepID=UPI003612FE2B